MLDGCVIRHCIDVNTPSRFFEVQFGDFVGRMVNIQPFFPAHKFHRKVTQDKVQKVHNDLFGQLAIHMSYFKESGFFSHKL